MHWVVDTYPAVSIKAAEHDRRDNLFGGALGYTIKSGGQRVPKQFKRALRCGPYKDELMKFLLRTWSTDENCEVTGHRTLYIRAGTECHCITVDAAATASVQSAIQHSLVCHQEEADTRMLLHAKHASTASDEAILLRSPDTDVLVLSVFVCAQQPLPLVFRVQRVKSWHYINVQSISQRLGQAICLALPGMHAFSGCDSTSQFAGHGKKKAMKLVRESSVFRSAMTSLGETFELDDSTATEAEKAICILYNCPQFHKTDEARNHKWNRVTKDITKLPPCQDSAQLHIKRANYQAAVWKRCLEAIPEVPLPYDHGWTIDDNVMRVFKINI